MKNISLPILLFFISSYSYKVFCQSTTFIYTGSGQTYTVPACVYSITVSVDGAEGFVATGAVPPPAGKGGRVQGAISVTPGEVLNINVGQKPSSNLGGWNGGANGGANAGGGGGASDIRQGGTALSNRIFVAGGGGGGGFYAANTSYVGGNGGNQTGGDGGTVNGYGGKGGTQSAGGAGGAGTIVGGAGTSGAGGVGAGTYGGGGGGGYFGGGGGANASSVQYGGGGGGGSSYASSTATGVVYTQGVQVGNGQIVITASPATGPPIPGTITGSSSACAGTTNVYSIANVPSATSYIWTVPSGATIVSGQGTTSISVTFGSNNGNIAVKSTNSCGTSAESQKTVIVSPTPIADAGQDVEICPGQSTMLQASGGSSYLWSTGATTPTVSVAPASTTTYSVEVTEAGCKGTDAVTVTVLPAVTANAGQDIEICSGESKSLTASGGTNYLWDTGEPTSSIVVSPTATTTYMVTVTNSDGCSDNADVTVTVKPTPTAAISGNTTICKGESATLTATGGNAYLWNTGDMINSIIVDPVSTTEYSVTVTEDGCTDTEMITVSVIQVTAVISATATSICQGGSSTLTASGGSDYEWSSGEITASITVAPAVNTSYTVTVTNSEGCNDEELIEIIILPAVTASITGKNSICEGESTTLQAAGGSTFSWNTGDQTASIVVSPATSSTYTVEVSDASGCKGSSSHTVSVMPSPEAVITGNLSICPGRSTTLGATGGTDYLWNTGQTTAEIIVSPGTGTLYSVTVTLESCSDVAEVFVEVFPATLAQAGADALICEGSSTQLSAGGGVVYSWSPPDGLSNVNISNPIATPAATTNYTVEVIDENGCKATDEVMVTIDPCIGIKENLTSSFSLSPNPSEGVFYISEQSAKCNLASFKIFNIQGQELSDDELISRDAEIGKYVIDLSSFQNGIYLLKIESSCGTFIGKLVKN